MIRWSYAVVAAVAVTTMMEAPARAQPWAMRYGAAVTEARRAEADGAPMSHQEAMYRGNAALLNRGREMADREPLGRYVYNPAIGPIIEFAAGYPERMGALTTRVAIMGGMGVLSTAAAPLLAAYPLISLGIVGAGVLYHAWNTRNAIDKRVGELNARMSTDPAGAGAEARMLAVDGWLEMAFGSLFAIAPLAVPRKVPTPRPQPRARPTVRISRGPQVRSYEPFNDADVTEIASGMADVLGASRRIGASSPWPNPTLKALYHAIVSLPRTARPGRVAKEIHLGSMRDNAGVRVEGFGRFRVGYDVPGGSVIAGFVGPQSPYSRAMNDVLIYAAIDSRRTIVLDSVLDSASFFGEPKFPGLSAYAREIFLLLLNGWRPSAANAAVLAPPPIAL